MTAYRVAMRRVTLCVVAGLAALVQLVPVRVSAASVRLTIKGKLSTSAGQNLAVLMVGNDGTSVRVPVGSNGGFSASIAPQILSGLMNGKAGKGPTLHVLQNGKYAGPVVLSSKGATGYTRISSKLSGTLNVGSIAMKTGYAVSTISKSKIDTSKSIRMKSGKPVSSGSVREAAVFGPVPSFVSVVTDTTVLGADSDRDGLPNFADADLNGDGILDAAQPETAAGAGATGSSVKLTSRPVGRFAFKKIIEQPTRVEVNSNANPSVTGDQILAYLTDGMSIEMSVTMNADELSSTSVLVDCRKLSYCITGSKSMIRAAPGDSLDGKELATLQNADGLIVMPQRQNENVRLLRFYPGAATASEAALAGDAFDLVIQRGGTSVYSEAHVVTSSFVTPMSFASFNGSSVKVLAHQDNNLLLRADRKIAVTFFRPQSFAPRSTSTLVDRGGMTYNVSMWPEDGSNMSYRCPATSLSELSTTLSAVSNGPATQGFFDAEQSPASNGTKLGFSVDTSKCTYSQTGATPTFVAGAKWRLELQALDSDSNSARIGLLVTVG